MRSVGPHHWPEDAAGVIDYYRADQRQHLLRTWVSSSILVYLGGALSLVPVLDRSNPALNTALFGAAGLLAIALGLLCTVQGLARALCAERYVSLRRDGLIVRLDGSAPLLIAWDELEEVRHQAAQRAVQLILRDGSELLLTDRYTDTEAGKLASLIATVRRRALWGYYDRR